jgi:N-acetylmuramoyl-L-alanine amidase
VVTISSSKNPRPVAYALLCVLCLIIIAALTLLLGYAAGNRFPGAKETAAPAGYPVIIIDAGHGGEDGGASGSNGVLEKDLNLEMAFILRDMLTSNGVPVIMTRTEDILLYDRSIDYHGRKKQLDLKARLQISNDNPGAIFVSIHMNSFPLKQYSGLQVYYPEGSEDSKALADIIQNTVTALLQPDNPRKPKSAGSNIYVLHNNQNTAVMVECGFLSNDAECQRLSNPEYRQQLSLALFCAIMEYVSEQKMDNP